MVGCVVAVTIQVYKILQNLRDVTDDVAGTVSEVVSVKENLKTVVTAVVNKLIDKIGDSKKGGEKKDGE